MISATFADRLMTVFGIVQAEAQQGDQQPELQAEEGEAEAEARKHLERQLRTERADGQLGHVAGEGDGRNNE